MLSCEDYKRSVALQLWLTGVSPNEISFQRINYLTGSGFLVFAKEEEEEEKVETRAQELQREEESLWGSASGAAAAAYRLYLNTRQCRVNYRTGRVICDEALPSAATINYLAASFLALNTTTSLILLSLISATEASASSRDLVLSLYLSLCCRVRFFLHVILLASLKLLSRRRLICILSDHVMISFFSDLGLENLTRS